MASAVAFASIVLLAAASQCFGLNPVPVTDCGSKMGKPTGVSISADFSKEAILVKGTNVTFQVDFTVNEDVSAATAKVYGNLFHTNIPFPLNNPDGCKGSNLECPLKKGGSFTYKSIIEVKKVFPKVKVIVEWNLLDQDKNVIWCVAVPAEITDPSRY